MKKLLLFLLFASQISFAQNVTIPDPEFLATLIQQGADTNGDGVIQVSEAQALLVFGTSNSLIQNMVGIEAFVNLTELGIQQVGITSLNVSGLTHLTRLSVTDTQISTLDVAPLTNLTNLDVGGNVNLVSLDVAPLVNLQRLRLFNNPLVTSLNVTALTNLTYLEFDNTNIGSINLAPLVNLKQLWCSNAPLHTLDLATLAQLEELRCSNVGLTSLDITANTHLRLLECSNNALGTLDLSHAPDLHLLYCENLPIAALDLSLQPQLERLFCRQTNLAALDLSAQGNLLELHCGGANFAGTGLSALTNLALLDISHSIQTALDVSQNTQLQEMVVEYTAIGSIDVSMCHQLQRLGVYNNPQLAYLNMKHGLMNYDTGIHECPALINVCVDESNLNFIGGQFGYLHFADDPPLIINGNNPNAVVSTYCSFTPGGNYNTIAGTVRLDTNGNGCDAADLPMRNVRIAISDGSTTGATFTDDQGGYTFLVQQPNLTLTPSFENNAYFSITPAGSAVNFPSNDNSTQTRNFCMSANGIHPDVEVVVSSTFARPGFDNGYQITYKNKGNQTVSGQVNFGFDDNVQDVVSASPMPDNASVGNLTFQYANLLPFESRTIQLTLNLNSPMETPAVNIDDVLQFSASITANLTPDETPADNSMVLNQTVVGSYDPNDKHCLEGSYVAPSDIGKYLHYVIHFENTGTAAAQNIVVRDAIDAAKFDIQSLQMLSASHPVQTRVVGSRIDFIFENIQLGAGAHGNVVFKIKTRNTLSAHAIVTNKADIFFDYNYPVTTDTATTTFELLSTKDFATDPTISVAPNPTDHWVAIKSGSAIESVELFDVNGRVLLTAIGNQDRIDISRQAAGMYLLKVKTQKGTKTQKLIKR